MKKYLIVIDNKSVVIENCSKKVKMHDLFEIALDVLEINEINSKSTLIKESEFYVNYEIDFYLENNKNLIIKRIKYNDFY